MRIIFVRATVVSDPDIQILYRDPEASQLRSGRPLYLSEGLWISALSMAEYLQIQWGDNTDLSEGGQYKLITGFCVNVKA